MEMTRFRSLIHRFWYGAHSPDSAERAARKGLNMVTNDMPANAPPSSSITGRFGLCAGPG